MGHMAKADLIKTALELGVEGAQSMTVAELKKAIKDAKGGNQYKPDPRQSLFLQYYLNPKSETFSNAKGSALKAGYSEYYSDRILSEGLEWLSENLRDEERVRKAEKVLDTVLDLPPVDDKGKVDNALIGNQIKASTLYLKGLAKDRYSERKEFTGKDGEKLYDPEEKKRLDGVINEAFEEK
jgi:hypothetical protein